MMLGTAPQGPVGKQVNEQYKKRRGQIQGQGGQDARVQAEGALPRWCKASLGTT